MYWCGPNAARTMKQRKTDKKSETQSVNLGGQAFLDVAAPDASLSSAAAKRQAKVAAAAAGGTAAAEEVTPLDFAPFRNPCWGSAPHSERRSRVRGKGLCCSSKYRRRGKPTPSRRLVKLRRPLR